MNDDVAEDTSADRCVRVMDLFRPWHPVCSGHSVPMQRNGSKWKCRVTHRVRSREAMRAARVKDPGLDGRYWHRADGGYIRRRRRELAQQREAILNQLRELEAGC